MLHDDATNLLLAACLETLETLDVLGRNEAPRGSVAANASAAARMSAGRLRQRMEHATGWGLLALEGDGDIQAADDVYTSTRRELDDAHDDLDNVPKDGSSDHVNASARDVAAAAAYYARS